MKKTSSTLKTVRALSRSHVLLARCNACSTVCGSPVHAKPIATKIMALGQAPGVHEAKLGKPFAFTAGKTLFKWLHSATGLDEECIREKIYFSAVLRCFPGKAKGGSGDREPSKNEIENCRRHVSAEVAALQPDILIAIGRVAIMEALGASGISKDTPLHEIVGKRFSATFHGRKLMVIPLPHPSGVSRWHQKEPGRTKLKEALLLIGEEFGGK